MCVFAVYVWMFRSADECRFPFIPRADASRLTAPPPAFDWEAFERRLYWKFLLFDLNLHLWVSVEPWGLDEIPAV